jgi:hypothetical protein
MDDVDSQFIFKEQPRGEQFAAPPVREVSGAAY